MQLRKHPEIDQEDWAQTPFYKSCLSFKVLQHIKITDNRYDSIGVTPMEFSVK